MKILTVVGARPQFIKASAFSRQVGKHEGVEEVIVHTGQHYDYGMSDIFFDQLEISPPKHNLDIGNLSHGAMTGRQLERVEEVLQKEKPDVLLVYGDTNSTIAGALAAAKLHIPVAHVEAGLRSFNRRMPEEINRVLTDHLARWLFAPTKTAVDNLAAEGITAHVHDVGDIMYDVALFFGQKARTESHILEQLDINEEPYAVATVHRAESTGDPQRLKDIFASLELLAKEMKIVLPLHPGTRKALEKEQLLEKAERVLTLCDPVGYLDMTRLVQGAQLVVTDSGGLQKEAFFHAVPCVTLRDETEWVELVEIGMNRLPESFSPDSLINDFRTMLKTEKTGSDSPYGQGDAARKILDIITSTIG